MITSDLIEYIKSQLTNNIPKDLIISNLSQVGWKMEDIKEGFLTLEPSPSPSPSLSVSIDSALTPAAIESLSDKLAETTLVIEEPKKEILEADNASIDNKIEDTVDLYSEFPDGIDIETSLPYSTPAVSKIEPIVQTPTVTVEKKEMSKIWTPTTIATKVEKIVETKEEVVSFTKTTNVEGYNLELKEGVKTAEAFLPEVLKTDIKQSEMQKEKIVDQELIPTINKNPFPLAETRVTLPPRKPQVVSSLIGQNELMDIRPKGAMISSYSQDILAAKKEEPPVKINKKNKYLKIGLVFLAVLLVSGLVYSFVEGSLRIPWSNLSLSVVKKDPRTILVKAPLAISQLESYKVETNINISSPSFSNITTGLASGEVVASKDRESIIINTKGRANHMDGKLIFDYDLNIKSSILKSDINSNLKFDGTNLFASIPDLKQILNKEAPTPTSVSFVPSQLGSVVDEFSPTIQDIIKKIDTYNLTSGQIPLNVKNSTATIFKDFIKSMQYVDKGEDSIRGVETYHYELTANRPATKVFLTSLADLFITDMPLNKKNDLYETLGSSSISAFDVWVGKNDDNLYQIKFVINAPLSQVLGLNDSGIAGNEVKLDWTTTYFDLDVKNEIVMPSTSVDMDGFIKNIRDKKIKNIINAFKPQASSLRNAIGSYGLRANPTGSCTNPNPGSLFSPKGHAKGADGAVSSISSSMNALLSATDGAGSCYSTSSGWALAVPLSVTDTSDTSFYCTDSSGNTNTLLSPISGTLCK